MIIQLKTKKDEELSQKKHHTSYLYFIRDLRA